MRRTLFLTFILFLAFPLLAAEICLKNKLSEGQPGSYLVTEQNKIYTLIHIFELSESHITLEEVSVPTTRFAAEHKSWPSWFEGGAPGHTSWIHSQINLSTGKCDEMFSFIHQGWIDTTDSNRFMGTLLNLSFQQIPETKRRRIGPPPGYNKPDHRMIWNPRLTVEGKNYQNVPFSAWKTRWPADGSELSGKIIEVYFPEEDLDYNLPAHPVHFPYWLEVEGKIGSAKMRVVDSGTRLNSPKASFPQKPPQLLGSGTFNSEGLIIELHSPSFSDYLLMAEEADLPLSKTFPLPAICSKNEETLRLTVSPDELEKCLTQGQQYRFLLIPLPDSNICLETPSPITYPGKPV